MGLVAFRREFHHTVDDASDLLPALLLTREAAAPGGSDRVEAGFAIGLGDAPRRADPPALAESKQGGVHRALVETQHAVADLFEATGHAESVKRTEGVQCLEDHQIERALQHFRMAVIHARAAPVVVAQEDSTLLCDVQRSRGSLESQPWPTNRSESCSATTTTEDHNDSEMCGPCTEP